MDEKKFLKKFNIKTTKARTAILEILENSTEALDAEEIHTICYEKDVDLDFSTVYRNLDLFESKGIVEKFDLGNSKYSYMFKREAHKHLLHCRLCSKEVEIECPMLQIEELIKSRTGFSSIEHELRIEGICKECKSHTK
jgi:Fur family ferric uptake transcriptional regulator